RTPTTRPARAPTSRAMRRARRIELGGWLPIFAAIEPQLCDAVRHGTVASLFSRGARGPRLERGLVEQGERLAEMADREAADPRALLEHGGEEVEAGEVEAGGAVAGEPEARRRHQRLDLDGERARALAGDGEHVPGHREGGLVEEGAPRRGLLTHPVVVEHEHPELVGGAEAILDPAEQAVIAVALALEVEDHVDHVLEGARSGDRAVLGDVAD